MYHRKWRDRVQTIHSFEAGRHYEFDFISSLSPHLFRVSSIFVSLLVVHRLTSISFERTIFFFLSLRRSSWWWCMHNFEASIGCSRIGHRSVCREISMFRKHLRKVKIHDKKNRRVEMNENRNLQIFFRWFCILVKCGIRTGINSTRCEQKCHHCVKFRMWLRSIDQTIGVTFFWNIFTTFFFIFCSIPILRHEAHRKRENFELRTSRSAFSSQTCCPLRRLNTTIRMCPRRSKQCRSHRRRLHFSVRRHDSIFRSETLFHYSSDAALPRLPKRRSFFPLDFSTDRIFVRLKLVWNKLVARAR